MFLPRKPCVVRVGDRLLEPLVPERELAPDVDEREVALDRERGDDDALDELVRIALDEHAVLERRRLALVVVDDEVARVACPRAGTTTWSRPGTRRRPGPAAPTPSPAPGRSRPASSSAPCADLVRAGGEGGVDRPRVVGPVVQPLGDEAGLGHRTAPPTRRPRHACRAFERRRACTAPTTCSADVGRHVLVELVVHLERRRAVAGGEALDLLDVDVVVVGVALLEMRAAPRGRR